MRVGITTGYGVGAHNAFYRGGEEGSGQEVGSQERLAASAISMAHALWFRRETETRGIGEPGREWKGGGGRAVSGPMQRRWPEAHSGARHGGTGQRRRQLGWASLGCTRLR
jgi:hypothetical protein